MGAYRWERIHAEGGIAVICGWGTQVGVALLALARKGWIGPCAMVGGPSLRPRLFLTPLTTRSRKRWTGQTWTASAMSSCRLP